MIATSAAALLHQPLLASPADPSCQVSEVTRLLGTMIVLGAVGGLLTAWRPQWHRVAALIVADVVWMWIDMEGPVLVSRGTHGIHLADVAVIATLPGIAVAIVTLALRQRAARRASTPG